MEHLSDEQLIAHLEEGRANPEAEAHLQVCEACREQLMEFGEVLQAMQDVPEVPAPQAVSWAVAAAIEAEQKSSPRKPLFAYWQVAAAATLLILGFFAGKWSASDYRDQVIALESQVQLLKEMTMMSPLQTSTASQRIQAVNRIEEEQPRVSPELVSTLVNTLNSDESPNVRYAAVQALGRFIDDENVRLALTESLEMQSDPLIQIALISMLVEVQEKRAISPLKELIDKEYVQPEVKKQAQVALEILT